MFKKILRLFVVVALFFTLVACTTNNENKSYDFTVPFNQVKERVGDLNAVTDNIILPSTVNGEVLFVWTSSDETVVTSSGKVTRGLDDKEATLTAVMKYKDQTATMSFTIKVLKTEATFAKIKEALEAPTGTKHDVQGTVLAVCGSGFYISDGEDSILVYLGFNWAKDLVAGDVVLVSGETTTYSSTIQFGNSATYVKAGHNDVTYPESKLLSASDMEAYNDNLTHDYVKMTGILSVSGNYYNVNVEGTEMKGSIVGPLFDNILNMDGKEVTVEGYVLYITGSSTSYLNIIATTIEGDTTPLEVTEATVTEIIAGANGMYKTEATVAALNEQGFLITDGTSYIFVYIGAKFVQDVNVGEKFSVQGMVSPYSNSLKQFSNGPEYRKVSDGTYSDPEPVYMTGEEIDAYVKGEDFAVKYISFDGTLDHSGSYYNVKIKNCDFTGSIAYPIETNLVDSFNGKYVKVTGYVLYISSKKYLNVLLTGIEETEEPAPDPTVDATISEIVAAGRGTYKTSAWVAGVGKTGYLLTDKTNFLFVYEGTKWTPDLVVGDYVTIEGDVVTYNDKLQFDNTAKYAKADAPAGEDAFAPGTPKELTVELLDACIDEITIEYVSLVGKLSISGSYYNVTVTGSKATGSLVPPIDDISNLNGKFIKVTGFVLYLSGGKYVNIITDSIEETEVTVEVTEATISEIVNGKTGTYKTTGTVVAKGATGFLLTDGTEYLFVYAQGQDLSSIAAGKTVEIEGDVTVYYGAKQFDRGSSFKVTGEAEFPSPSFKELTAAEIDAYKEMNPFKVGQVKISGKLAISGSYYNLTIEGAESTGSIVSPAILIDSLDGKDITVEGYVIYLSGSSSQYFSVLAVTIYVDGQPFAGDEPLIPTDLKDSTEFDFVDRFATYAKSWGTSYTSQKVTAAELGFQGEYEFTLSNVSKQAESQPIHDRPVLASKNDDKYIIVSGDFSGVKSVTFDLTQWNTKTFKSMKIQYTTDGSTWTDCSDVITDGFEAQIKTNIDASVLATATQVRLVFNGGNSKSNVQFGLNKIILEK